MNLMRVGDQWLNMDLLVRAERVRKSEPSEKLTLQFSAPSPASVGASDWSIEPFTVHLAGEDAAEAIDWLEAATFDAVLMAPDAQKAVEEICVETVNQTEFVLWLSAHLISDPELDLLRGAIHLAVGCTRPEVEKAVAIHLDEWELPCHPRTFKGYVERSRQILQSLRRGESREGFPRVAENGHA
jgi:hypothetical protein